MSHDYFSDRENGPSPRVAEEISLTVWKGLHSIIIKWYNENAFCGVDGYGQDMQFVNLLSAEIPALSWPLDPENKPSILTILDLIEFCYNNTARTTRDHVDLYQQYQSYSERNIGQYSFREDINKIFKRNGLIYELNDTGQINRLVPEGLREKLQQTIFHTGDSDLDRLFNSARMKFLDPDLEVRKEALEKLWDAWERLKTLEHADKRTSMGILLDKTSPEPNFRERLDDESRELTEIGNKFRIRHHEIDKISIDSSNHVDYLFQRLFALIYLILEATSRIK